MANPERQNLILLKNDQGQPTEIHINPKYFSRSALREIMRFQIFRVDALIEIVMFNEEGILLSASTMLKARDLFGKDRRRFLGATASAMHNSTKVIIRSVT